MATAVLTYRLYDLPWATGWEQDQRFLRLQKRTLGVLLFLCLLLSVMPLPELDPMETQEIPTRFARLLLERQAPPPPVVIQEAPEPEPEPEAEPEPEPEPPRHASYAYP